MRLEKTRNFDKFDAITNQNEQTNMMLVDMNIEGYKLINSDGEFEKNKQKEKKFYS